MVSYFLNCLNGNNCVNKFTNNYAHFPSLIIRSNISKIVLFSACGQNTSSNYFSGIFDLNKLNVIMLLIKLLLLNLPKCSINCCP